MKGLKLVAILLFAIPALISCETEKREDVESKNRRILRDAVSCVRSADGKVCACCNSFAETGECTRFDTASFFVTECEYAEEFFIVE